MSSHTLTLSVSFDETNTDAVAVLVRRAKELDLENSGVVLTDAEYPVALCPALIVNLDGGLQWLWDTSGYHGAFGGWSAEPDGGWSRE